MKLLCKSRIRYRNFRHLDRVRYIIRNWSNGGVEHMGKVNKVIKGFFSWTCTWGLSLFFSMGALRNLITNVYY